MRTIKASEVRKGMRVRVEASNGDATITTEGVVTKATGTYVAALFFGDYGINLNPDHPVTVLAEPEPEWVEGAWYWLDVGGHKRPGRRVKGGWSSWADGPTHGLSDDDDLTVLGRVLIVDWPGDDVARDVCATWQASSHREVLRNVADAIRTQGGAP